jgi:hypothetical protein
VENKEAHLVCWPRHCPAQNDLSWKLHIWQYSQAAEQANVRGYEVPTSVFELLNERHYDTFPAKECFGIQCCSSHSESTLSGTRQTGSFQEWIAGMNDTLQIRRYWAIEKVANAERIILSPGAEHNSSGGNVLMQRRMPLVHDTEN